MEKGQGKRYNYDPLGFMRAELSLGSHLCCFYENDEQRFDVLIPYLANGIINGEKCICIGDEELSFEVKAELGKEFDILELIAAGSLVFVEQLEVRTKGGAIDPAKMLRFIRNLVSEALKEGWPSCRIAGECDWLIETADDQSKWLEFEAMLNMKISSLPAIVICQHSVDEISAHFMMDIMRTHPWVILYGSLYENQFFVAPDEFPVEQERPRKFN